MEVLGPDVDNPTTEISTDELVKLGAVDTEFYAQTFFPKTFRQRSPQFGLDTWAALENPDIRLLNLMLFRGSGKTTRLRTFASKRIAYGTSRTILYIGASESKAIASVAWLRNNVERNALWRETFGLAPGRKWEETQIEIRHKVFGHSIWVQAAGATGSLRGLNFEDYRPDLIIVDDPVKDEEALSAEQNRKLSDLILSAVKNSLAPVIDEPNAKLVMACTPQQPGDPTQEALADTQWHSLVFPCWTPETVDLPVDEQFSAWEERFPTAGLREDKLSSMRRNRLSLFTREMECRLISPETASFRAAWLNIRPADTLPENTFNVLGIDPVPPPSTSQIARGLVNKDYEAHYVWGRRDGEYHLLDYARNKGHQPSWTVATALTLARKWRVAKIVVEAVAYQRTLEWLIRQEMTKRGIYYVVIPYTDRRSKFNRITSTIGALASDGRIWIGPNHSVWAQQFEAYPNVEHDDDLDASAIALGELNNAYLDASVPLVEGFEDFPLIQGNCP